MIGIEMEIPKSCKECRFLHGYLNTTGNMYKSCDVNDMALPRDIEGKSEDCPLIDLDRQEDDLK